MEKAEYSVVLRRANITEKSCYLARQKIMHWVEIVFLLTLYYSHPSLVRKCCQT